MNQSEEIKSAEAVLEATLDSEQSIDSILVAMERYANQFKSEWVSVDERLPELFAPVLAYTIHGNIAIGNLCYDSKMWNLSSGEPFRLGFVSHWKAFPTPPKV